jgi:hypothetical protein
LTDTKIPEIPVSIDGEFTGPIPGVYSMISLGAVAYDQAGKEISRFKVNLREPRGAIRHSMQEEWWSRHPAAWEAAIKDPLPPRKAMRSFAKWLRTLPGQPKLIGWPLPVDFMFVYWYYWRYIKRPPPFGFDGIDIISYAMRTLDKKTIGEVSRKETKKTLGIPHVELSHLPDEDAAEQGEIFFGLRDRIV